MAYQPSRSPFAPAQQESFYQNSRNGLRGYGLSNQPIPLSNKVNGYFEKDRTLPLYKDKPFFQPRRTGPRRRWRPFCYILLGCSMVFLLYYNFYLTTWSGLQSNDRGVELWKWAQTLEDEKSSESSDWAERREKVRDAFIVSWEGYEQNAWGYDQYRPVSNVNQESTSGGLGWMIVDSLDTLMIMNLTSKVHRARQWISTSLQYDQDREVNTFETSIRMLGGLLSAHHLSTQYPNLAPLNDDDVGAAGEDLYIEKAADLAERLLGAFDSPSGIPWSNVNLNTSEGVVVHFDEGATPISEAGSLQLEFKYLAKLTGEAEYWEKVEKTMQLVDLQQPQDGLVRSAIHPDTGHFKGDSISLGNKADSYYEYLIKQYLQTSQTEPIYKEMWDEALQGIRKHLISFTKNSQLMVLGERPQGLDQELSPRMDHLVCFMPGTIALGATGGQPLSKARKTTDWSQQREEEILIARELMKTCWAMHQATATGLAAEISYFVLDDPPLTMADKYPALAKSKPEILRGISKPLEPQRDGSESWRSDIDIRRNDRHNLQRPETIESLVYMYRITGDEIYREWGWEIFKSFIRHTAVVEKKSVSRLPTSTAKEPVLRIKGFTSLGNADAVPPYKRDNMESYWMAETLKYFYLLFSDKEFISLEDHVFNTEAHPFPRFKPSGELKTGWERKPKT
ncbi:unnamed protein product [Penicillium salamii]|uniref:alpha-1,2-Mannosidase n=1 Tax=Penicillium salamii TaxID=1612424 RepID=A0A9W4J1E6_9EURO|nr:unnamed protein product [Penicillium salamii]CAG8259353.1 unnamed protein product [Penicillium salamii]CAG8314607.1 unnamed protein product [Penicillium salamii]CAG8359482.1 unnamed protein product [Penicillium salamii]CAG8367920.1 unnamed protein product [Penicillium salamii]